MAIGALSLLATGVSTAFGVMSTLAAGQAQAQQEKFAALQARQQADANMKAAELQAAQYESRGKTELAAASRAAEDRRRRRDLAVSKFVSQAAASGFAPGTGDLATLEDRLFSYGTRQAGIDVAEGRTIQADYQSAAEGALFEGRTGLQAAELEAKMRRANAKAAQRGSYLQAGATLATGFGEGFEKYKKYY